MAAVRRGVLVAGRGVHRSYPEPDHRRRWRERIDRAAGHDRSIRHDGGGPGNNR